MSSPPVTAFPRFEAPHRADPYPLYARLRKEAPVFYSEEQHLWVVSRLDDARAILRDPATFLSLDTLKRPTPPPPEVREVFRQGYPQKRSLVDEDPPKHTRIRALAAKAFLPQRIAALEPRIRQMTDELIDAFVEEGQVDIVARFNYPLPAQVIGEIIGVPAADRDKLKGWAEHMTYLVAGDATLEQHLEGARSLVSFQHYVAALIADRRASPRDDLVTALLEARHEEGDTPALSDVELIGLLQGLHFAGHETTTNLLSNALLLLLGEPSRWAALQEDPSRIARAVEEALRLDAPVQGTIRTTSREVSIGGVAIPKGAKVFVVLAAANRDEAEFAEPDRFDLARGNAELHLSFGRGIHFCLGASLARLEAKIALERLGRRLPNLRLARAEREEELTYATSLVHRGPKQLWLAWDLA